ncbi:MAG: hypothetical protein LBR33_01510 [Propionibacteriaceae bacterium]|nr:hypothetical protein [Propionibacteriaceae bacterium]
MTEPLPPSGDAPDPLDEARDLLEAEAARRDAEVDPASAVTPAEGEPESHLVDWLRRDAQPVALPDVFDAPEGEAAVPPEAPKPVIPDPLGEFTATFWAGRKPPEPEPTDDEDDEGEPMADDQAEEAAEAEVSGAAASKGQEPPATPETAAEGETADQETAAEGTADGQPEEGSFAALRMSGDSLRMTGEGEGEEPEPTTAPAGPVVVLPEDEGIVVPPPPQFAVRRGGRLAEVPVLRVDEDHPKPEPSAPTATSPTTPAGSRFFARFSRFLAAPRPAAAPVTVVERLREGPPTDRRDRLIAWIVTIAFVALGFGLRLYGVGYPANFIFDETYYPKDAWTLVQFGYEKNWISGANEIIVSHDYRQAINEALDADGKADAALTALLDEKCPKDTATCDWAALEADQNFRDHVSDELESLIAEKCPDGLDTCTWNGMKDDAEYMVHPELGKWLIGLGELMFGFNSFGWRFMSVVFGSLLIGAVIRLGRRLSRSTLIGGLAGLFITFDGLSFVMSRIGLLDIFEATFIVLAVGAVVADRDYFRHQLADRIEARGGPDLGGASGGFIFRPWLLVAGVMFGLACATKWNAMYPLAVFGLLVVAWSVSARRLAGARGRRWSALWLDGVPAFASLVVLAIVTYTVTWLGWLTHPGGWGRDWGDNNSDATSVRIFGKALGALWHYNVDMYNFHTGDYMAGVDHVYRSNPLGWLFLARPIGFDAINGIQPGTDGCPTDAGEDCLRVISATGTPLLWWLAALALVVGLVWWLAGADWRFGVTTLAVLSTWVPWIMEVRWTGEVQGRPLFFFYAITLIPFLAIGLAMVLGVILGPAGAGRRRFRGAIAVGTIAALIVLNFAFIYPILTDGLLLHSHWQWRMWFSSWI